MSQNRNALTPEALTMVDVIARTGSFAAAARELGKVPSALTYNVRQLEDALDVLLFDRRSRQATLTPAGQELLDEGRRLLEQIDAVAHATGAAYEGPRKASHRVIADHLRASSFLVVLSLLGSGAPVDATLRFSV